MGSRLTPGKASPVWRPWGASCPALQAHSAPPATTTRHHRVPHMLLSVRPPPNPSICCSLGLECSSPDTEMTDLDSKATPRPLVPSEPRLPGRSLPVSLCCLRTSPALEDGDNVSLSHSLPYL